MGPGRRTRRVGCTAALTAALIAVLALPTCDGNPSGGSSPRAGTASTPAASAPASSPKQSPVPLPRVARSLDPGPKGCPGPLPKRHIVGVDYGGLFGHRPAWGGFYAEFNPRTRVFRASDAPRMRLGWRIKVLWIVHPDQVDPVTIRAHILSTDQPLWFDIADGGMPSTAPALDVAHPENVSAHRGFREFPSYMYFPSSGCYLLEAEWPDGRWALGFGFGR